MLYALKNYNLWNIIKRDNEMEFHYKKLNFRFVIQGY